MLNSWQQLCRLCAKENGTEIDVFVKSENDTTLAQTIQKYFLITISPYDQTPTMICTTCYKSITNLVLFAEHTSKVEAFFTKLMLNEFSMITTDINILKFEHGLSEFVFSFPDFIQKRDQETNTNHSVHPEEYSDMNQNNPKMFSTDVTIKNGSDSEEKEFPITKKRITRQTRKELSEKQHTKLDSSERQLKNETSRTELTSFTKSNENTNKESIIGDENYIEVKDENIFESESVESEPKSVKKRLKRTKSVLQSKKLKQTFQCDKCNRYFKTEYHFQRHIRKCHSSAEKKTYPCEECAKEFATKDGLRQHALVHLPPELKFKHSCLDCDKKFTTPGKLRFHISTIHEGQRLFVCDECGKLFRSNGALQEHKIIHTDETRFECKHCSKKFKFLKRLKEHEDTHDDTCYTCPECGLKLNTKRILRRHMVVHSNKKEFKCDYCGNEYKRLTTLKNHLILHTNLRPYTCPFCDKTFANGSNCRKHKKLLHPVELAAMEAAGEVQNTANIPKLSQLKAELAIQEFVPRE